MRNRTTSHAARVRIGAGILLLVTASCRASVPAPGPTPPEGPPDLTGQVVDVRIVRTLGGTGITFGRLGGTSNAEYIQRVQVRVIEPPGVAPGADATIGIDGSTILIQGDSGRVDRRPELPGAYIRVWFRGSRNDEMPPINLSRMARRVVVDSVAKPEPIR